jgi:5-phospho-D-xylono-1,4-lactonase
MGMIRTVLGDVDAAEFGPVLPHEHLLTDPPPSVADPDFRMDSEDAAIVELRSFRLAGGRAIIEMSPRDYGRNPAGLKRLSEATGVHIVCVTGWHKDKFCRPWVAEREVDDLADEMIREITEGIDATGVRAGVIKIGTSLNQITPAEDKVFRAAARAQRATGVAISTHTEVGTMGLEQVALLRAEGVPADKIVVGHTDHRLDIDYHRELLATGVTLGYDQISKEKYAPDSRRVAFILRLVEEGYANRLLLSTDLARRSNWPSYGNWGGPGLTFIPWRFVPWLVASGLDPAVVDTMLVHNPARVFQLARE